MTNSATGISASAIATGAGIYFGLHADAMLIGFIAGLVTLLHVPPVRPRTPIMIFLLVAGSAFLSGVFSPILVSISVDTFTWAKRVDSDSLRLACAAAIGGGIHLPWVRAILLRGKK